MLQDVIQNHQIVLGYVVHLFNCTVAKREIREPVRLGQALGVLKKTEVWLKANDMLAHTRQFNRRVAITATNIQHLQRSRWRPKVRCRCLDCLNRKVARGVASTLTCVH